MKGLSEKMRNCTLSEFYYLHSKVKELLYIQSRFTFVSSNYQQVHLSLLRAYKWSKLSSLLMNSSSIGSSNLLKQTHKKKKRSRTFFPACWDNSRLPCLLTLSYSCNATTETMCQKSQAIHWRTCNTN